MARIRSVHPGLFTDEEFMGLSALARVLLIGLWVESDDQGVFEWKPRTLKARLLPNDVVDMVALLAELVTARFVLEFADGGKPYGAVRNFRKYQRPKKPNAIYPLPSELRTYVGLTGDSSEPVPHQNATDGEKSSQMEDGGGRVEEVATSDEVVEPAAVAPAQPTPPAKPAEDPMAIPTYLDRRKGTRLPAEWTLPEDWRFWAEDHHPDIDIDLQSQKFANYWWAKPGKEATKTDWFATWRNWILSAKERGNGKRPNPDSVVEGYAAIAARHQAGA